MNDYQNMLNKRILDYLIATILVQLMFGVPPLLLIYISYFVSSTANSIIPKLQDSHHPNNRIDHKFFHPFMQTEMMAISQMLCLVLFLLFKNQPKQDKQSTKPKAPIVFCFLYMLIDVLTNVLELTAINYLSPSVYGFTGCIVIVSSAFFSKIIMGTIFNKNQIFGCILVMMGVSVTAFSQQIDSTQQQQQNLTIGITLTLLAYFLEGLQMVFIQYVFQYYQIPSTKFLGIAGTFGTCIWTILLFIFSNIGCPFQNSQCVEDYNGSYHLQNLSSFFMDLNNDSFLIITSILYILATARYYYDINEIIINGNAMIYQLICIFSGSFTTSVGITITLLANGNQEFIIQRLDYKVILVKLIGFGLITLGLLLYQQIIWKEESPQNQGNQLMEQQKDKS